MGYFAPNGYGLYDMAGNVAEWCWDWYDIGYYSVSSGFDPRGPSSLLDHRVVRGGAWWNAALNIRIANRYYDEPVHAYLQVIIGFRCVKRL